MSQYAGHRKRLPAVARGACGAKRDRCDAPGAGRCHGVSVSDGHGTVFEGVTIEAAGVPLGIEQRSARRLRRLLKSLTNSVRAGTALRVSSVKLPTRTCRLSGLDLFLTFV